MRIVVAVNAPSRHLFPLFVEWSDMGHEVLAVVDRLIGRLGDAETYRRQGIEVFALGRHGEDEGHHAITTRTLRRLLLQGDAAVAGGYRARSARVVLTTPRRLRPPTVLLAERPDHRTVGVRRSLRDSVIRLAIRRADAVWAMSINGRAVFESLGAHVPILAPYPLPETATQSDGASVKCWDGVLRIAVVGQLDDRKDPLMAAAALGALKRRGIDFEATFYGDGPLREALLSALDGLPARLAGHVSVAEVEEALTQSDVLLHPCRYDGWGMVVAEAVVAETSVVAGSMTDAASELAKLGSTVRIVQLHPERIADELVALADLRAAPDHQDQLARTRVTAWHHAGVRTIASRTTEALERMLR